VGDSRQSPLNLNSLLAAVEAAPPGAAVDVLAAELTVAVGAREVSFLIADFSGRSLIRLGHAGGKGRLQGKETAERVPLVGTPHGRALAAQAVEVIAKDRGARLFAPVTSRGEAVGVLELGLDDFPVEETVADVALAAHFLAYVVIANRRYTDLFEWGQRSVPLSLAAEIQHRLLPGAFTCEAGQFTLAAWLQPAGEIGGDTFDFSLERDTLHVSMTDAMGHTWMPPCWQPYWSGVYATPAGGELSWPSRLGWQTTRWPSRPGRASLSPACSFGSTYPQHGGHRQRRTSSTAAASGGPRRSSSSVGRPPFGLRPQGGYRVQSLPLDVGDRPIFVTDGMLDRDAAGMNIAAILTAGSDMHPREAVQHLTQAVLRASGGQRRDDATALFLDWHGGPPRDRDATSGAIREARADSGAAAGRSPQPPLAERWNASGGRAGGRSRCRAGCS
jgi:Stage II sporulation protein E (SpoIIE)